MKINWPFGTPNVEARLIREKRRADNALLDVEAELIYTQSRSPALRKWQAKLAGELERVREVAR